MRGKRTATPLGAGRVWMWRGLNPNPTSLLNFPLLSIQTPHSMLFFPHQTRKSVYSLQRVANDPTFFPRFCNLIFFCSRPSGHFLQFLELSTGQKMDFPTMPSLKSTVARFLKNPQCDGPDIVSETAPLFSDLEKVRGVFYFRIFLRLFVFS